ncbi:hypothetical protein BCR44DRAFT_46545 [Catenaria anguillulae PL171]|uniref:Uncharacterized protein n=1 Tax=Catenaria anguillulae PL171 TaxID=765915 RepID=A0A1Y2HEI8_9FUNG|nr:hypothetical protein BCR44DRAFT_46545 [Catenaria anguillulae PL171]
MYCSWQWSDSFLFPRPSISVGFPYSLISLLLRFWSRRQADPRRLFMYIAVAQDQSQLDMCILADKLLQVAPASLPLKLNSANRATRFLVYLCCMLVWVMGHGTLSDAWACLGLALDTPVGPVGDSIGVPSKRRS